MKTNGRLTEEQARAALEKAVSAFSSQKTAAVAFGIHPSALTDMLKGRRDLNATAQAILGLRRVVSYERVEVER